jgi:DNA mismatch endonuclease (patch repair protein)
MADIFSREKRSEIMSQVRSRGNRATEVRLVRVFRKHRLVGWRRNIRLFGNPDFVFPAERLAIFVDGCFWHSCPLHGSIPLNNRPFWKRKLARNRRRDILVSRELRKLGWRVIRIWQHELGNSDRVAGRVRRSLCQQQTRTGNTNSRRLKKQRPLKE